MKKVSAIAVCGRVKARMEKRSKTHFFSFRRLEDAGQCKNKEELEGSREVGSERLSVQGGGKRLG